MKSQYRGETGGCNPCLFVHSRARRTTARASVRTAPRRAHVLRISHVESTRYGSYVHYIGGIHGQRGTNEHLGPCRALPFTSLQWKGIYLGHGGGWQGPVRPLWRWRECDGVT